MKKLSQLKPDEVVKFVESRWNSGATLFTEIAARKERNLKIFKNEPEWLDQISSKKSKARQNRIFTDLEHVNNFLLARPSMPLILGGKEDAASAEVKEDLHAYLVKKNSSKQVKTKIKRAMRQLYTSRLFTIKVVWDVNTNDWALKNIDVKNIRFSKRASNEEECEVIQEKVTEPLSQMLARFDEEKQKKILTTLGKAEDYWISDDCDVTYIETWATWANEDVVIHTLNNEVISLADNPYWDYNGLRVDEAQREQIEKASGRDRRPILEAVRDAQPVQPAPAASEAAATYAPGDGEAAAPLNQEGKIDEVDPAVTGQYFFNYFDRPRKPYIFATIFDMQDGPVGETDFFDQANPLQENADEGKRQVADNRRLMNGVWLVDKAKTGLNKSQVAKIRADAEGYILANNATTGIKRDTGVALPNFVLDDIQKSLAGVDDAIGAGDTFRGVQGSQETAEGRAILREQALGRMTELVNLIDYVFGEIYGWELQLMKLKYTERHYAKVLGKRGASRAFDLLQDDIEDDLEIQIKPGMSLPEDKIFRSDRAKEAFKAQAITPEKYLEETGWENAEELAKEAYLFAQNPAAVLDLTEEDKEKLGINLAQGGADGGATDPDAARADQIRQVREMLQSPEFQQAPAAKQAEILSQLEQRFPELDIPKLQ